MVSRSELLRHIRFADARKMVEVPDGAAALTYLSPPYVGHHTRQERGNEKILLQGLLGEAARATDSDGFVVTYNTDFRNKGGFYPRHDVVREAAEKAELELYAHKIHIDSFAVNTFRLTFHHVQVFIHEGSKETVRKKNKRLKPYSKDVWYFNKRQRVGKFRDAIPPEVAVIPIANFTEPGDLVISQCAGTGTVVIAAIKLGRKALGYEIGQKRAELMKIREKEFEDYFSDEEILGLLKNR